MNTEVTVHPSMSTDSSLAAILACPKCGNPSVLVNDRSVSCPTCRGLWSVDQGVPLLCKRDHETYKADELTPDLSGSLIDMAARSNWQEALDKTLSCLPKDEAAYLEQYICSSSRGLLTALIRLEKQKTVVLDHGCGWGALTSHVAPSALSVVAMDLVKHRARFTAIRSYQEGNRNVMPIVSGDYERLPFRASSFDTVIMNGVLEWVPCVMEGEPQAVQTTRLKEVSRVLRPGGQFLLAIENRYWWRYFIGQPEVHSGVRAAAITPRWLANIISNKYTQSDFRTYTYSLRHYYRLLSSMGLSNIRGYWVIPEYNFPSLIIPINDCSAISEVLKNGTGTNKRISLFLSSIPQIFIHFAYCYLFIGNKD